jgi:hypothetical protein
VLHIADRSLIGISRDLDVPERWIGEGSVHMKISFAEFSLAKSSAARRLINVRVWDRWLRDRG